MGGIYVKCPVTGLDFHTGINTNKKTMEGDNSYRNMESQCLHCGQDHKWSSKDAFIKEIPGPASRHDGNDTVN